MLTAQEYYSQIWLIEHAGDVRGDWPIRFAEDFHIYASLESYENLANVSPSSTEKE